MSLFAKPEQREENLYGVKILYLHGLESSSSGTKATYLRNKWSALTPDLRTQGVARLRKECNGDWSKLSKEEIGDALSVAYSDALDAVSYAKPDIIVGSSLGAALLYKLYASEQFSGGGVFLAPAVPHLLSAKEIAVGKNTIRPNKTVWLLAELDSLVPNGENAAICELVNGNVLYSPNDEHRLNKGLESGLIDAAILTAIECSNRS